MTRIPELLREQGRTVAWFCRQVGIHRSYYWMMENGKRPLSDAYLSRAAEVLNVSKAELSTDVVTLAIQRNNRTEARVV